MISVLMSVYNEKLEWIKQSVESILNQTYKDFEYIIVIDNPDLNQTVLNYLKSQAKKDSRILLHKNAENMGLMNSLNVGIKLAKGDVIARMDADDISFADRFEEEIKFMNEGQYDMISANRVDIDENGQEIGRSMHMLDNPQKHLPYTCFIVHPSVMVKTSVLRELGGYREFYNSEDYDMWLRILSTGYSIGILREYVIYYRIRQSSMSLKNKLETYYINKYQQQLYWERVKTGSDSFSLENFRKYMDDKDISEERNRKFCAYRNNMDLAISKFKSKNFSFIGNMAKAFCYFPSAAVENVSTILRMR